MYMPVWGAGGIVVVVEDEGGVCANKISTKDVKMASECCHQVIYTPDL